MSVAQAHDLVIVGGGIAGLVAANRAAELGLRAAVLEKGTGERYACNTRFSGGAFHICMRDIRENPDSLVDAILRATDGAASRELAQTLAEEAPRTYLWLKSRGLHFVRAALIRQNYVLAPVRPNRPGLHWEGRGGDVLLRTLEARLLQLGGQIIRGAKVTGLLVNGGACTGVAAIIVGKPTEVRSRAVLIADGGFQNGEDLLRDHISKRPDRLKQRGAATGTGDGARMARAAGAALVGMDGGFYGHLLCRDALQNEKLWPFPFLDFVAAAGVVVDGTGQRFADEGQGGVYIANRIARHNDPLSAIVVFDNEIWEGPGRYRAIPPNPHLVLAGGTVRYEMSLSMLARSLHLPEGALERTVSDYNAAVDSGQCSDLTPARTAETYKAYPLRSPPFYAVNLCAGITYTMGGIRTDSRGRVLRADSSSIDGLYAAGATTGGLEGGPRFGYVGGLMKSAVFGLRAAESVATSTGARVEA